MIMYQALLCPQFFSRRETIPLKQGANFAHMLRAYFFGNSSKNHIYITSRKLLQVCLLLLFLRFLILPPNFAQLPHPPLQVTLF